MASASKRWTIEISRTAEKQISKLNHQAQSSILGFLREKLIAVEHRRLLGKPLHGDKGGLGRYRVGDYRLTCDIRDERITVVVLEVGHRKDVYR